MPPLESQRSSRYKMCGGGRPVDTIELRYCPKDPCHWRVDEPNGRCPVCRTKIQTAIYALAAIEGRERNPVASTGKQTRDA